MSLASTSWEKDSVEFFLNEMNRHASYSAADGTHIRVDIRDNRSGELPEPAGVASVAKIAAGTKPGYTVEIRIPFKVIAPVAGNVVGFDMQVNDAAGSSRRSIFGWNDDQDRASGVASALGQLVFAVSAQTQEP
jgi:endo-1,4-beta-xylanase